MYRYRARRSAWAPAGAACALALAAAAWGPPASAVEFEQGDARIGLDTTISHGVSWRLKDPEFRWSRLNSDDGDLNYERGIVSNTSRFTSELDVEFGNIGAFARVQGFVDFENRGGDGAHKALPGEARDRIGDDIELLDFYASGAFDAGDMPIDARLGYQVLNWGESTFIQGGVNVVNPLDAARLRKPGAELREGLLPVPMISVAAAPTDELSVEAFYQLKWAETRVDPSGTYFATNDYATPGGTRAYLNNPLFLEIATDKGGPNPATATGADLARLIGGVNLALDGCQATSAGPPPTFAGPKCLSPADPDFLSVSRGADMEASDSGQWGVALRYYSEALADTEFGFFFVNHHSRLPLVSARYGTVEGFRDGLAAAGAATQVVQAAVIESVTAAVTPAVTQAVLAAQPQIQAGVVQAVTARIAAGIPAATPNRNAVIAAQLRSAAVQRQIAQAVESEIRTRITGGVQGEVAQRAPALVRQRAAGPAAALAIDRYGRTARYFVEYPEDLQVFGFSFNTVLGTTGWALQGEYSYHPDTPLQRDDASMFALGLAPLTCTLDPTSAGCPSDPAALAGLRSLLNTKLTGYIQRDVSQMQATATKVIGPVFGADGAVFIAEAALSRVHDMPDQGQAATKLETFAASDDPADDTSWGYRAAGRLDYNNAIGAARLSPYAQFQHDVSGNSPGPSGQFVEGRTALTLGLGVGYLDSIRADLSYTMYGGKHNYLADRDFVALSASYSF